MKNKHLTLFLLSFCFFSTVEGQDTLHYGQCKTAVLETGATIHSYILPEVEEGDVLLFRATKTNSLIRPNMKFRNNGIVIDSAGTSNIFDQQLEVLAAAGGGVYSVTFQDFSSNYNGEYQIFVEKLNIPTSAVEITSDDDLSISLDCGPEVASFYFSASENSLFGINASSTSLVRPCIEVRKFDGEVVGIICENEFSAYLEVSTVVETCFSILVYDYFFDGGSLDLNLIALLGDNGDECINISPLEICDNYIDDDGDDLIDCEDPDCWPEIISVTSTLPSAPDCNDGEIIITAEGQNLEYDIYGGAGTFQASNTFSNLEPGTYNIRVWNSMGECFVDYNQNPVVLICDPVCEAPEMVWLSPPASTCPESPIELCMPNSNFNFDFSLFQNGAPTGEVISGNGETICFTPTAITEETIFGVSATLKTDEECVFLGPSTLVSIGDLSIGYSVVPETGSNNDGRIDLCVESGIPPFDLYYSPQRGEAGMITSVTCLNAIEITDLRAEFYEVIITDSNGCTGRQIIKVGNKEKDRTGFPEKPLLTPNGDGRNDVLIFGGLLESPDDNELTVYNRFGSVIYQAAPYQNDWACTYNGSVLPAGVYYYTLIVGPDDEVYTGFITIV